MEYKRRNIVSSENSQLSQLNNQIPLNFQVRYATFLGVALESIPWIGNPAQIDKGASHTRLPMIYKIQEDTSLEQVRQFASHVKDIFSRFDRLYENISKRIEEDGYLNIARTVFSLWNNFKGTEKIKMAKNLIVNSAATTLCSDEVLAQMAKWISQFQKMHLMILDEMKQNSIIPTTYIEHEILKSKSNGKTPESYYFKSVINELTLNGLIEKNQENETLFMTSLGSQLIYYSMESTVRKIE